MMCQEPSENNKVIFDFSSTFRDLGLKDNLLKGIEEAGFTHPTIVQARLIPKALEGTDILGQSRTGSGKTAAFGLPILEKGCASKPISTLVLVPTRELAIQVQEELSILGKNLKIKSLAIYGGQSIKVQTEKLKENPTIIVGTPGRIIDMQSRKILRLNTIKMIVLDEVDRMLDIGFRDDIKRILGSIKNKRQTIFVSATLSDEIKKLAHKFMNNPIELNLTKAGSLTVQQVDQSHFIVPYWAKTTFLTHLIKTHSPTLALVFCRTKATVEKLNKHFEKIGLKSAAIHGDLRQNKRNNIMTLLKNRELSLVIASDLASRGIDVEGITHVINYDLPEDPEVYVHRIGRTARAGKKGTAWSLVATDEGHLLDNIEMLTNNLIKENNLNDFDFGPIPESVKRKLDDEQINQEKINSRHQVELPPKEDIKDNELFPGGIVPSSTPKKRLGGRAKTRKR